MTSNLFGDRSFEEAVVALFNFMGYHTGYHGHSNTVLHTMPRLIHAEIYHPRGKQRFLIECKHRSEESISVHDVEKFCSKVAFARENYEADFGMMVSKTSFTDEALIWCDRNCSFVQLKTYRQLVVKSMRFRRMLNKFHKFL
jgi:hypothetical protein